MGQPNRIINHFVLPSFPNCLHGIHENKKKHQSIKQTQTHTTKSGCWFSLITQKKKSIEDRHSSYGLNIKPSTKKSINWLDKVCYERVVARYKTPSKSIRKKTHEIHYWKWLIENLPSQNFSTFPSFSCTAMQRHGESDRERPRERPGERESERSWRWPWKKKGTEGLETNKCQTSGMGK